MLLVGALARFGERAVMLNIDKKLGPRRACFGSGEKTDKARQ